MSRRRKKPQPSPADVGLMDNLKSANGRAFLWDLLEDMGCFRMSADLQSGPLSPYRTYFNEGVRSRGNKLLARIQAADVNGYLLMQREALERASENVRVREQQRASEHGAGVGGDDDGDGDN